MMGGKVLDLPEIRIYKQAKAEDEAIIKSLEEDKKGLEEKTEVWKMRIGCFERRMQDSAPVRS